MNCPYCAHAFVDPLHQILNGDFGALQKLRARQRRGAGETLAFELPELRYPERLNCATELLEGAHKLGRGERAAIRAPGGLCWTYAELDAIAAAWRGDTLEGVLLAQGQPAGRRIRLLKRTTPFTVERLYSPWPGPVSDSVYAVTEDTLVFMRTRDGARLASYIARPVGNNSRRLNVSGRRGCRAG